MISCATNASLIDLVEYAAASTRTVSPSVRLGYWAVVSFEARLKMCDAMVLARLRGKEYEQLASRWKALKNRLNQKARKRAEIAHGSVVTFQVGSDATIRVTRFVPAFHRKLDEFAVPQEDGKYQQWEADSFQYISVADMQSRFKSFRKTRQDLIVFLADWIRIDAESRKTKK